jgi:hypothetical protein
MTKQSCSISCRPRSATNIATAMRRGLPSTDWIPPVLTWYQKFNTKKLLDLVIRVDNKSSADWIAKFTPSQRIHNMNDVFKNIDQAKDEVFAASALAYDPIKFERERVAYLTAAVSWIVALVPLMEPSTRRSLPANDSRSYSTA